MTKSRIKIYWNISMIKTIIFCRDFSDTYTKKCVTTSKTSSSVWLLLPDRQRLRSVETCWAYFNFYGTFKKFFFVLCFITIYFAFLALNLALFRVSHLKKSLILRVVNLTRFVRQGHSIILSHLEERSWQTHSRPVKNTTGVGFKLATCSLSYLSWHIGSARLQSFHSHLRKRIISFIFLSN